VEEEVEEEEEGLFKARRRRTRRKPEENDIGPGTWPSVYCKLSHKSCATSQIPPYFYSKRTHSIVREHIL